MQPMNCAVPDCEDTAIATCDSCDRPFCEEHGQRGGDRQIQDVGPVAYPSLCDICREEVMR
jgi:hypothetical protein